jgi:hypothetical protein
MIVSPGRGYVFVHIPKTGGTSMALALESRAMKDDILIGDTPKARARRRRLRGLTPAGRLWKHSRLADIEGLLPPDTFDRLVVFTMVRNPWERIVSYYHWLRVQSFDHPAVRLAKSTELSAFLNHAQTRTTFARKATATTSLEATGSSGRRSMSGWSDSRRICRRSKGIWASGWSYRT